MGRRDKVVRPWSVDYKSGDEAGRTYALAPRKPKRKTETALTREIMVALNRLPGVHVFRNNTGALADETGRVVYYGLGKGSPDLVGWVTGSMVASGMSHWCNVARFLGVEVKMPGKMRAHPEVLENQDRWRDMIEAAGGIYVRVTSVEEAVRLVRG